ncbi:YpsA SLOG family protein [Prosthecobacter sp.]|uniref:YpsA SLOG family protein n=1 Tax=Prosthecobacter sp. TaxID=1965333 RepID=UPI003783F63E
MKKPRFKIISGAQTGVDRAALDAALAFGVPCGGWVPAGRHDEDGPIPAHYPVKALKEGGYKERTIQNLCDADGTLILYFEELEGGTELTVARCIKLHRPYHLIDGAEISAERAAEMALRFVTTRDLRSLNVAGPRGSKRPEGYAYALEVVSTLLMKLGFQRK